MGKIEIVLNFYTTDLIKLVIAYVTCNFVCTLYVSYGQYTGGQLNMQQCDICLQNNYIHILILKAQFTIIT